LWKTTHSASEFDAYAALIGPGKWSTRTGDASIAIADAPVFFKGGEVSWGPLEGA
jgi:hypothetical protein